MNMEEKIYDVIIIGSGPAGLSAAIYAERAKLSTLVLEASYISGGQVVNTYEVDNYPGLPGISGMELGNTLREHAEKLGTQIVQARVEELELEGKVKKVITKKETFQARTVLLATGAAHRGLGVPGEKELSGSGVSYCATCDGAFFKNLTVAVVGGGDVAVEDAIFLARACRKVYVVHRRDSLRAAKALQERLFALPNIEMVWNSTVQEITGDMQVESITISKRISFESADSRQEEFVEEKLPVDGCFIAVGILPNNKLVKDSLALDEGGYVKAGEDGITSIPGVFAAGDIRTKQLRQIITAAADGANCITSIQNYLLQ